MDTKLPQPMTNAPSESFDLSNYQTELSCKLENILNDTPLSTSFLLPSSSLFEPRVLFGPIEIESQNLIIGLFYNKGSMDYLLDRSAKDFSDPKSLYDFLVIETLQELGVYKSHGFIVDISSYHFRSLNSVFVDKPHFWAISSSKFSFTFSLGGIKN